MSPTPTDERQVVQETEEIADPITSDEETKIMPIAREDLGTVHLAVFPREFTRKDGGTFMDYNCLG